MKQAEQISTIEQLLAHLDHGTNVDAGCQVRNPISAYTCPDRATLEWERFFSDYPHVLGVPMRFGMGYGLTSDALPMGPNPHICYWGGYGGSTIVVDQDARLCVSYVMNHMEPGALGDPQGFSLLQAAYQSLA